MSPWRICFRHPCPLAALLAFPLAASVVTGTVEVVGAHRHLDTKVAVWLEPRDEKAPSVQPATARMVQRNKQFQPHVLAIQTGAAVEFPNYDPIFHNAFSNIDGQPFDLGLYPPGSSRRVVFHKTGIVRVFCNIHQSMSAVIVVQNTPWIGVTGQHGEFRFAGVPEGEYTLRLFYERATQQTLDSLAKTVVVTGNATALPPIAISGTGYIPAPHKNKYGLDYPLPDNDRYGGEP